MKLEILSDDRVLVIFENDSPVRSLFQGSFEGLIIGSNDNKIYRRWLDNLNDKNYLHLKITDLWESTPLFFEYLSIIVKSLGEQNYRIPLWLAEAVIVDRLKRN